MEQNPLIAKLQRIVDHHVQRMGLTALGSDADLERELRKLLAETAIEWYRRGRGDFEGEVSDSDVAVIQDWFVTEAKP